MQNIQNYFEELTLYLREINTISIIIRLTLATICGGILGAERGRKKRPAGFRTHILVCIGAAMIMITSQYMSDILGMTGGASRMGAQVISGIGFLGAGTIMVVGKNEVKGLTTAAGLWACACMGLAVGIGFYEGAILSCIFLYAVVTVLHRWDVHSRMHTRVLDIYVELEEVVGIANFMKVVKSDGTKITNVEVRKLDKLDSHTIAFSMTLTLAEKRDHNEYMMQLNNIDGVCCLKED